MCCDCVYLIVEDPAYLWTDSIKRACITRSMLHVSRDQRPWKARYYDIDRGQSKQDGNRTCYIARTITSHWGYSAIERMVTDS